MKTDANDKIVQPVANGARTTDKKTDLEDMTVKVDQYEQMKDNLNRLGEEKSVRTEIKFSTMRILRADV